MNLSALPALNATLNASSAVLLVAGVVFVAMKRITAHLCCMLGALGLSAAFLVSYVVYHVQVGSVPFSGTGWVRPVYFAILISHVVLAAVILPLALRTVWLAITNRIAAHRSLARWTVPVWLYVSVTGVVVYWMLY